METSKFAREGSRYKAFQREGVRCVNVPQPMCVCVCVCVSARTCVLGEETD